jgi:TPP-dependent 2-oxoacid decarboxylase
LKQHGVAHLFGVPGDYNLALLDDLIAANKQEWVGTTNELNAGYAADAYARRRGLGAVLTSSGAGELSCLHAIAGSHAEQVPVVQISGVPATTDARTGTLLHRTFADGGVGHFAKAYREVTAVAEVLSPASAATQIDHALATALATSRPVYLAIPVDVAAAKVDGRRLAVPLPPERIDSGAVAAFTTAAQRLLRSADGQVTVVAGHQVERRSVTGPLRTLVEAGPLPVVTLVSSKGAVDEDHPCFAGVYCAEAGVKSARVAVDQAAVLITVGALLTDVAGGLFTARKDPAHTIDLQVNAAFVAGERFEGVPLRAALAALTPLVGAYATLPAAGLPATALLGRLAEDAHPRATGALSQVGLWETIEGWLPSGATLLAEAGTAFWGAVSVTFPPDTSLVSQPVWNSIGYTLPATLGAGLAEPLRRPVLVIGDGAAQMTVQELGTIAGLGLCPVVVLVNNTRFPSGRGQRAVARYGATRWDWGGVARSLAPATPPRTLRATTVAELRGALQAASASPTRMVLIEAVVPPDDAPPLLRRLAGAPASDRL